MILSGHKSGIPPSGLPKNPKLNAGISNKNLPMKGGIRSSSNKISANNLPLSSIDHSSHHMNHNTTNEDFEDDANYSHISGLTSGPAGVNTSSNSSLTKQNRVN